MIRVLIRWLVTIAMVSVGILHFVSPAGFVSIVPDWLPAPEALVPQLNEYLHQYGTAILLDNVDEFAGALELGERLQGGHQHRFSSIGRARFRIS